MDVNDIIRTQAFFQINSKFKTNNLIYDTIISLVSLYFLALCWKFINKLKNINFIDFFIRQNSLILIGRKLKGTRWIETRTEYTTAFLSVLHYIKYVKTEDNKIKRIQEFTFENTCQSILVTNFRP